MTDQDKHIRDVYIPELMKGVFKRDEIDFKDYTQEDWIKFHQAIYDKVKEKEVMSVHINKN